jgi:TATA-binding protein-associated factor
VCISTNPFYSLQRFKIDVASTVVNQQNSAIGSMETDQLLDLFNISSIEASEAVPIPTGGDTTMVDITEDDAVDAMGEQRVRGKQDVLEGVAALWDDKQYEEEYNLDSFLASMK